MSEMTPCNFCTLQGIKRRAEERGATVDCHRMTPPEMREHFGNNWQDTSINEGRPWWIVLVSDEPEPPAMFVELSADCVC